MKKAKSLEENQYNKQNFTYHIETEPVFKFQMVHFTGNTYMTIGKH